MPRAVFAAAVIGLCVTGCVDENNPPKTDQPAMVRVVSSAPRPAISSICIGDACDTFDPADQVRAAESSSFVVEVVPVEVLLVGEEPGFGTGGPLGPGGCMDVSFTADAVVVEEGCVVDERDD